MSFAVMRRPVLMEDEGRHEFIQTFISHKEAETWITAQKNKYFKPQDYYILESTLPTNKDEEVPFLSISTHIIKRYPIEEGLWAVECLCGKKQICRDKNSSIFFSQLHQFLTSHSDVPVIFDKKDWV